MTDLMRYAAQLTDDPKRPLPPVAAWTPPYCGELNLVIRADGLWVHEGTPIARAPLVRLFSTVLRREGDRYFLVTPVEKLGIRVEDAPFLAIAMRPEASPEGRRLFFTTNVGDEVVAGPGHALDMRHAASGRAPYLHVRAGLDAKIARAVWYDLVALGETREIGAQAMFGAASGASFFPFGPAGDMSG
ncbi:MAG: DUF1285 domain-containing protein [Parvularculaceae bacterium]|nr:DUF1285 domain-containing protein [Parvularculaceae bacterium]